MANKAAAAAPTDLAARVATLEALVASLQAQQSVKAPKISSRKASFKTWGVRSLAALVFVSLPLMARGATLEVTAGGSPSPPMIQFSDASGNLAATLTGSVTLASRPPLIL